MILAEKFILTSYFVLVVVRWDDRFLLIQEGKQHQQQWYVPAGRVEPGEHFVVAARRETFEEAGISVAIEGILRIEYTPEPYDTARLRIIFVGKPKDDRPLKNKADEHSLQAKWVRLDELNTFPLRGHEVREMFRYVADGGTTYPLSLLTFEGAPFIW